MGLANAGRKILSINSEVSLPPLPCPSVICLCSKIGRGHDPSSVETDVVLVSSFSSLTASSDVFIGSCAFSTVHQRIRRRQQSRSDAACRPSAASDGDHRHSKQRKLLRQIPWSRPMDAAVNTVYRTRGNHAAF